MSSSSNLPFYEPIPDVSDSFEIQIFKLSWKEEPKILQFEKIHKKLLKKEENLSINSIWENEYNNDLKLMFDIKDYIHLLFYIHTTEGVAITKSKEKVDCFFNVDIKNLLRLCVVDVSIKETMFPYYSTFVIAENSKYYFDLSKCNINMEIRNNQINKNEEEAYNDLIEKENKINDSKNKDINKDYELTISSDFNDELNLKIRESLYEINENKPFKTYIVYDIQNKKTTTITNDTKNIYQLGSIIIKFHLRNGKPIDQLNQKDLIKVLKIQNITFDKYDSDKNFKFKDCIENIQYYHNLVRFIFTNNTITSSVFKGWNYIIKYIFQEGFNLQYVNLSNNSINDAAINMLLAALEYKRIRYLDISGNKISNKGMESVNNFLEKCISLNEFNISKNNFSKTGLEVIANSINKHPNLFNLNLSENNLAESGQLLEKIILCKELLHFYAKKTNLTLEDYKFIKNGLLYRKSKIYTLDLGFNPVEKYEFLKEMLSKSKTLQKIYLQGMQFNSKNYGPIFEGLSKSETIDCCYLDQNPELPINGLINFFMKKNSMKEIGVLPYKEGDPKNYNFSYEDIRWFKIFHSKFPNVKINGVEWNKLK